MYRPKQKQGAPAAMAGIRTTGLRLCSRPVLIRTIFKRNLKDSEPGSRLAAAW